MKDITFRTKDFYMMEVRDTKGKKIGLIKDIDINFSQGRLVGFVLSSSSFFSRNVKVLIENIVAFNEVMIVNKTSIEKAMGFKAIEGLEVIDTNNNILGIVDELIFDGEKFEIKGLIISSGLIKDFVLGKRILLCKNLILGEENILCIDSSNKIDFLSKPHKLIMEADVHEKMV